MFRTATTARKKKKKQGKFLLYGLRFGKIRADQHQKIYWKGKINNKIIKSILIRNS